MTALPADRPRIGWIGCGRMGAALARRLLKAGYDVLAYNRTRAKAEALVPFGATVAGRAADLADRDVVFTMVAASHDLEEVTAGEDGVLTNPDFAPKVLIDSSTVSGEASAGVRVAALKRGTEFLAAPVSGNPKVVDAGRVTLAVSGPRPVFDQVQPVLAELGRAVTYVGEDETARLVKICHNVFLGVVIQSMAEITVLAEKGGVSRSAFLEFLNQSVMGSAFSQYKTPALVRLDFTPTFTMPLLRKDFDLGLQAARALEAPMPLASAAAQLIASAVGAGHVDEDFAALILEQARRAGWVLEPENTDVTDGLGGEA
ncbi:NAD(P)-dependent oxidoreductase [Kibdelosporangium phytohabitans]|uniref:6-phosphogluconate dehydrogenase n=1 Tax=Kibdelosporangium phytohabitans TaxID=860235 RepID=A0A0N9HYL6_9PSEU|nr:NAD(P)-dependent oxidoreductase [Kibdelosporangium phytohabitans]ALG07390.1 6-phosphogluconate dehydrogenase [Kibdelosporangium phytohabitans]MBE1471728.1 3-hydroxyisobutyrate dehydrogenase-like beta-hydroxyacid dehydrogenase [Kibdelosporangium phytohabitans]